MGGLGLNGTLFFFIERVRGILRCGCTVVSPGSFYAICCEESRTLSPGRTIHIIALLDVLASPLLHCWFEFCNCKIPYSTRYLIMRLAHTLEFTNDVIDHASASGLHATETSRFPRFLH